MNLLYQFNEKYAPYAGVSLYSVLENNRHIEQISVYILGEGLSSVSVERIRCMAAEYHRNVYFPDTSVLTDKLKSLGIPAYRGSYAANMRLFPDDILDTTVDRVLYLDADTVVDSVDMRGNAVGMVLDSLGESHKRQIGLAKEDEYYNSGVILFDMVQWRKQGYSFMIVEHIQKVRNHYPAPDQDLLNAVCKGHVLRLGAEYNFQPIHAAFSLRQYYRIFRPRAYYNQMQLISAKKNPIIYHCFRFIGEFPWHKGNVHPFNGVYDAYMKASPWSDYQKQSAHPGVFLKAEKIIYRFLPGGIFLCIFRLAHFLFLYQSNRDSLKNKTNKMM